MSRARAIQADLQRRPQILGQPGPPLNLFNQVRHWVVYARTYLSASLVLRDLNPPLLHPWAQVTGHAFECAIKSYLCAAGRTVPEHHNLVDLVDLAIDAGLTVEDRDLYYLVDINHLYERDLHSQTKFKARYPSKQSEVFGGTIPDAAYLARVVGDFCSQASKLNETLNRVSGAVDSSQEAE